MARHGPGRSGEGAFLAAGEAGAELVGGEGLEGWR